VAEEAKFPEYKTPVVVQGQRGFAKRLVADRPASAETKNERDRDVDLSVAAGYREKA
jgi:hypothetical protein